MLKENKKKQGKLIVFSAPSGSGKTTIVRHLLKQQELNLEFSISATSREARGNEAHGKDYYYLSLKEFKNKIKADEFLEWEEVYRDNFYGTLKTEIERIVKPPDLNELVRRLKDRGEESEEKISMRVAKAPAELATAPLFDVIVVNSDLDQALENAYNLVSDFIAQ